MISSATNNSQTGWLALTDTANLHGAVEFTQAAKEAGVKPILGAELRVNGATLLLHVESARGYQNLCNLLSRHADRAAVNADATSVAAQQRREFHRGEFEGFTEGLIAVSSDTNLATQFPHSFYKMVTAHDASSECASVACPPVHYATPADRQKFDIVQSIRTLTAPARETYREAFWWSASFSDPCRNGSGLQRAYRVAATLNRNRGAMQF